MDFHRKHNRAVAPVLATILMIAVAVAMSVILFMWSQGFLANTSGATGGQQGAQNQAAQSSISVETATFTAAPNGVGTATLIVRNVGAVSVNLGSAVITGSSANSGFHGSVLYQSTQSTTTTVTYTSSTVTTSTAVTYSPPACTSTLSKGSACTLTVPGLSDLSSGDVLDAKVTTSVGTFATAQFTVP